MVGQVVTNGVIIAEVHLAGLLNVQLLGGDKEDAVADVEKEHNRLNVDAGHQFFEPVHQAHPECILATYASKADNKKKIIMKCLVPHIFV